MSVVQVSPVRAGSSVPRASPVPLASQDPRADLETEASLDHKDSRDLKALSELWDPPGRWVVLDNQARMDRWDHGDSLAAEAVQEFRESEAQQVR